MNKKNVKIEDIVNIHLGSRIVKSLSNRGKFPVYGGGDETFSTDSFNREGANIIIGRFALSKKCTRRINKKFYLNDSGFTVSSKNDLILNNEYLFYIIEHLNNTIYNLARGAGQKNLNMDEFKKLPITIPESILYQEKIVKLLKNLDDNIEDIDDKINKYQMLKKAYMQKIKSDILDRVELKEICSKITAGGTPNTSNNSFWEEGNIPWLNSGEVNNRYINKSSNFITQLGLDNSSTKLVPKDTIVMALAGQGKTRGKVAILQIEACTNQSLACILIKKEFNPYFVFHVLEDMYENIRGLSQGGGREGLNLEILKKIQIPKIFKKQDQDQIALTMNHFDSIIENLLLKQKKIEQIKKGLLNDLL